MSRVKTPFSGFKPSGIQDATWRAVIEAWTNGLSDREAAFLASKNSRQKIKESDIKSWLSKNPDIAELKETLQADILAQAKLNIKEKIAEGDIATSKWYLERKAADEFSTKAAVSFEGAAIELSIEDKEKASKDFMKQFGE